MVDQRIAPDDAHLLEHLYDLAGCEDNAFACDLLAAFLYSSAESLQSLDVALSTEDPSEVGRVAHRLKSSFTTLAMHRGAAACVALEEAALTGDLAAIRQAGADVRLLRSKEAARAARLLASLT